MESEMQTAGSFQESTAREFIQACNAGNLEHIVGHLHPTVHYQSYAGGIPDVILEGRENIRFYLETRSNVQDYQYTVRELESSEKDVRIIYECCVTTQQREKRMHSGMLLYIFTQGKIIQIVETS